MTTQSTNPDRTLNIPNEETIPVKNFCFEALFENRDKLTLTLHKNCVFEGYEPARIWELSYGVFHDRIEGPSYKFINAEYFPETQLNLAAQSFGQRAISNNPSLAIGKGFSLDTILTKKNN